MRLRLPSLVVRSASKAKSFLKLFTSSHGAALVRKPKYSSSDRSAEVKGSATSGPSAMFAVIIGIDTYQDPSIPHLGGAAADADAVNDFLVTEVGVAKDRIVNLRNFQATRAAIMQALNGLATNREITADDPILIYYAGHGGEAPSPLPEWRPSSNGKIQMLLPYDFVVGGSSEPAGQGLWDVSLSSILDRVAHNKSDNITVIFDCCHSGSGTRDVEAGGKFAVRGISLPPIYAIPKHIFESEVSSHRTDAIPDYHIKSGLRSHVLLASCQHGQGAAENYGRGVFTSSLLDLLQVEGIDELTYQEVIMRIKLPLQNPQCEGVNQTRVLFNSKVVARQRTFYSVTAAGKTDQYTLDAGTANGITNGAEFTVYSDKKMTDMLGIITAHDTTQFSTRCSIPVGGIPFALSGASYAAQIRPGAGQALRLSIQRRDELYKRLNKAAESADTARRTFRFVKGQDEEADLEITSHNSLVRFKIMDKICRQWGLTTMPFDMKASNTDGLLAALRSAADFYWNLRLSRVDPRGDTLTRQITLECFKLTPSGKLNDSFQGIMAPKGQNLINDGAIFIDVDEKATYGFNIKNNSTLPLYAALFYFDVSDLSIEPYYLPGTAANGMVDFSLPVKGSLSIGFGDSGTPARVYYLRDKQEVDIGFLKLYLSTQFVDFSGIAQASPFQADRRVEMRKKEIQLWYTITIPIIQRRGSSREV